MRKSHTHRHSFTVSVAVYALGRTHTASMLDGFGRPSRR